jgi:hypothetical protein
MSLEKGTVLEAIESYPPRLSVAPKVVVNQ